MTEWHPLRSYDDGESKSWKQLNELAEARAKASEAAEMPSLEHASMQDFDHVYEPSDDTYLLIDAIKSDLFGRRGEFHAGGNGLFILDIGTGSGVPITFLSTLLGDACASAMATDINRAALEFARKTATENGVNHLELLQADLAGPLLPQFQHSVDIIIFNPPYVPTPDAEVSGSGIEASWAGGAKGRRVIDRAIPQITKLLARPNGIAYMITVDDNEPEDIAKMLHDKYDLEMIPLLRRRANNEFLTVQKIRCI